MKPLHRAVALALATLLVAAKLSDKQKIALAMSAGPARIAKAAAIVDMTDTEHPRDLRAGANGWVCYAMLDGPMCLDKVWQKWLMAWTSKGPLALDGTGIGYMLAGDKGSSNTDPYATAPNADNQWVVAPPHIMVLYPDPQMLDAYPTDPSGGGPWVIWKGTPYAHVMVPVSVQKAAILSAK